MKRYLVLLLAVLAVSCGGGGDSAGTGSTPPESGGGSGTPPPPPPAGGSFTPSVHPSVRVEETNPAVTLSSGWTAADTRLGWSGGSAVRTSTAGSTVSFTFTGNSVRWLGGRGRSGGKALVRIDGGAPKEVSLLQNTGDIARTPIVTIFDLTDGPHTLTIEVVSGVVIVDGFDVNPQTSVSHLQDTDPNLRYSAGWTKSDTSPPWSGNGAQNLPELPVTAQETTTAGATVTLPFRGTAINWVGYRGPDGGIATVQIDGGAPVEVDTYSATSKVQEVVFAASGLADGNHTITITATGGKNAASSASRIVVDAFDVMTPGRRYENDDPLLSYSGNVWNRNHIARVWSGGSAATSNVQGAHVSFRFTGTSVSWIGCRKSSAGGTARVYIDDVLQQEIRLSQSYPIEGYQMTIYRADGLAPGQHTIKVEVVSATDGPYVVVDAFDVHP
jgi:hypothetical protein